MGAMTVDEARALMHEWTQSVALRKHMECVAVCMGAYADRYEPAERDRWIVAGLLHDMDYEKHPSEEEHPFVAVEHLRHALGVGLDIDDLLDPCGHDVLRAVMTGEGRSIQRSSTAPGSSASSYPGIGAKVSRMSRPEATGSGLPFGPSGFT